MTFIKSLFIGLAAFIGSVFGFGNKPVEAPVAITTPTSIVEELPTPTPKIIYTVAIPKPIKTQTAEEKYRELLNQVNKSKDQFFNNTPTPTPSPTPQIIYIYVPTPIIVYVTPTPTPTPTSTPTPTPVPTPTSTPTPTPTPSPTPIIPGTLTVSPPSDGIYPSRSIPWNSGNIVSKFVFNSTNEGFFITDLTLGPLDESEITFVKSNVQKIQVGYKDKNGISQSSWLTPSNPLSNVRFRWALEGRPYVPKGGFLEIVVSVSIYSEAQGATEGEFSVDLIGGIAAGEDSGVIVNIPSMETNNHTIVP